MADQAENTGVSKSAKRRAAKKANAAAASEAEAAPEPAPAAPKAVPKAKATATAEKAPEPKAKAKAKAKAAAVPEPVPDPKAKAKGAAKAKAKATPEPPKEEPKAKAAPKAAPAPEPKQAAKAKAQPKQSAAKSAAKKPVKEEEERVTEKVEIVQPFEVDDGKGDGWEMSTGVSKKKEKQAAKLAYEKEQQRLSGNLPANQKAIPGLAMSGQHIPGMAPAPGASTKDSIKATMASAAAAGAAARKAAEEEQQKESNSSSAQIKVPEKKIGVVIGPKGSNIKMIQEKTGVTRIDTSGEVFTISGPPQAVSLAEHAIKELIEKGYCSMAFEDFKEEFVAVHPTCFPDLIGKEGVVIKAFKKELGVEVSIPSVPKNATGPKKYRVTLAGKKDNVEKAKEVITHIATYGYHETTHEGFSHAEMEVPGWCYSFLIGKAGSELKHIQNNYKVKVNIPREHSLCQNVVVVGAQHDVDRAQAYIEKILWNAENASKGRDRQDGPSDPWGDEEPEEDWMKQYMYKRK